LSDDTHDHDPDHTDHDHDHEGHDHEGHDHEEHGEEQQAIDAMLEAIRQARVGQLVVSSISTFASVAYGKLETGDLPEAKLAIDVIDALLPFLQGDDAAVRRDFEQALTGLKVSYAGAAGSQ
jgi:hypothetical protein